MQLHQIFSETPRYILSLLFCSACLVSADFHATEKNVQLNDHLTRKLREARVSIAKEFNKVDDDSESVITVSYDVEWEKIRSDLLNFSEPRLVFRLFDKMFILEDNRTLSVVVKSVSNETSFVALLPNPSFLRQKQSIKLVKSIVWKSRLYLLVCEEDDCTLYIGENDSQLEHGQTLNHPGMFDATFFTRDNRLYLLVTHDKTVEFLGSSTIYHWTGTYMDIIQPIETVGDVLVTVFNYGRSTIIVFGQPASDGGLEIYEYYKNRIERISYLPINGPISVIHYHHDRLDFLLIINKQEASRVYWWDGAGREFLHWVDILDIVTPHKVKVAQLDDDTFFFVSYESSVCLYKVTRSKIMRLDILDFKITGENVIDMEIRIDEKAKLLTLIVVTFNPSLNQYRIEPWNLHIRRNRKNKADIQGAIDTTEQCLSALSSKLNDRMIHVENLTQNIWPQLLSSEADIVNPGNLVVPELILGSLTGENAIKIGSIEIDTAGNDTELLLPNEINGAVKTTSILASKILNDSLQMLKIDGNNTLTGNVVVEGDLKCRELRTSSFRTSNFNGQEINFEDFSAAAITATTDQTFNNSKLRGKNVTVRNLEIDQLCGIPHEYWLRAENESNNIFNSHNLTDVTMENDTITVESKHGILTVSLRDLDLRTLDDINITDLFHHLFIPGKTQRIKGNILQKYGSWNTISVANLVAENLNGVAAENLLTIATDQNITGHLYVSARMLLKNVVAKRINGIDVADFAMVSKENHFKGELTVAKLRILNHLVVENSEKFTLDPPVQVYDSVTVLGNVRVKNIEFQSGAKSSLSPLSKLNKQYWTKSTKQRIKNRVIFDKGLRVDELKVDFLNDLDPNKDIMMTNTSEIFALSNSLEFKNLTVKHFVRVPFGNDNSSSAISPQRLYEDSPDSLIINEEIRIERLSVATLFIENFNGVPVNDIMTGSNGIPKPYVYRDLDSVQKFETLTVKERLEVEDLHLMFVHDSDGPNKDQEATEGKRVDNRFPRRNENYTIHSLKSDKLNLGDLAIDNIAGMSIRDFMSHRNSCFFGRSDYSSSLDLGNCSYLTIEGDALIEGDLEVSTINGKKLETYFDDLVTGDFLFDSNNTIVLKNLTVHKNMTLNVIQGVHFDTLYENILSKSRAQNLGSSKISFSQIFVDDLITEKINDRYTNDLIYIDSSEMKFDGDVVFSNLSISSLDPESMPNIRTKYLNGYSTLNNELSEKLGTISPQCIASLRVRGSVFWRGDVTGNSTNLSKFETIARYSLLRNKESAVVIDTNGTESTVIKSTEGVFVTWMRSKVNGTFRDERGDGKIDVENILRDSVLDVSSPSGQPSDIQIGGKKIFKKDLKIARLTVLEDIDIKRLNSWSIDDLNSSIVLVDLSKNDNVFPTMNMSVTFRNSVSVRKLVIHANRKGPKVASNSLLIHGLPIDGIFTLSDTQDYDKVLPDSTYFEHLVVLDKARVKYLDSVDFDDFARNRVSLSSDSKIPIVIHGNIQFNGIVRVSGNASIGVINGIVPSDLVLNGSSENQIIAGNKTLISGDLVIQGEAWASQVAGINLTEAYNNAVLNKDQVEIFGDIIFESDVERSPAKLESDSSTAVISGGNIEVSGGFVNGISLKNVFSSQDTMQENFLLELGRHKSELEARIARISKVHLPEIFFYFEEENHLAISEAANVERVRVTKLQESSILSLYTNELGNNCGLANECFCRRQYVAELTGPGDDCRSWKVHGPRVFYHFRDPSGAFAINVATTTVSRDKRCTLFSSNSDRNESTITEFTTISWLKHEREHLFLHRQSSANTSEPKLIENDLKIYGYVSDTAVFTQNDAIYIVLAIYYDPIKSSHKTNSFVYVLDLATNALKLLQYIPTSYAVGVEVFQIPNKGHHIFFSSYADGKATESQLYRLETHSSEFRLLRSFPSGGNRHAKSVSRHKEEFLFLDDVATTSMNVYRYDTKWDNFHLHQNIFYDSMAPVTSIETFYTGEFRSGQVYVIVVTERDQFFVYEYTFMSRFQLIVKKKIDGILSMVPFDVADRRYVFVGSDSNSTVLRIVEQGNGRKME
ncbi:uncharacterized protein [Venturia canescens]|uniref:uncharacterized protein n=1 Tax=Venturia canescens TaxID=32260 RepID=UPI001C9C91D8|nr:uncharacterized protein LOC122412915 [Venturia canescens]